ncbi:MAG: hypothetical protein KGJ13_09280 [Patescibacteria group bacterium]|nr:hypothetical protein [Patescibacteria group bacterium]
MSHKCETGRHLGKAVGRPVRDKQAATGHIHLRVTLARKGWYVRYARLHGRTLADWMQQTCDAAAGYPPNPKQLISPSPTW